MNKKSVKILSVIFTLVFVIFALASCGSAKSAADQIENGYERFEDDSEYGFKSAAVYDSAEGGETVQNSESSYGSNPEDSTKTPGGLSIEDASARKIIRNAELGIETKNFDEFIENVDKAIAQNKGYAESMNVYGNSYYGSSYRTAHITARIPSDNLEAFIGQIGDMGNIKSKTVSANDITAKYTDTQARIDSYEAERTALLAILEKAEKIDDIIQLRDKLTEVNAELDSLKRQIKSFDSLVAYSTVKLDIDEVDRISPANTEKGFFKELGEKLSSNLYNIGQGAKSFAIWFISSLPYFLIIAAIITVFVVIIRKAVRKKRAKKAAKKNQETE